MSTTIPALDPVTSLATTDVVMITHSNGTTEKISGANLISEIKRLIADEFQKQNLFSAIAGETTVEGALGALSTNKQPKTLDTTITIGGQSKTSVEDALGALNSLAQNNASSTNPLVSSFGQNVVNFPNPSNYTTYLDLVKHLEKENRNYRGFIGTNNTMTDSPDPTSWGAWLEVYTSTLTGAILIMLSDVSGNKWGGYTTFSATSISWSKISPSTNNVNQNSNTPITSGGVYNALQNIPLVPIPSTGDLFTDIKQTCFFTAQAGAGNLPTSGSGYMGVCAYASDIWALYIVARYTGGNYIGYGTGNGIHWTKLDT